MIKFTLTVYRLTPRRSTGDVIGWLIKQILILSNKKEQR